MKNKFSNLFSNLFSKKEAVNALSNSEENMYKEDKQTTDSEMQTSEPESVCMKKEKFHRLEIRPNGYCFTSTRRYSPIHAPIKKETVEKVFDFAYSMSYGGKGEHRGHRSGGTHIRKNKEIFIDAFQGKLAECALFNSVYKLPGASEPDFSVSELGIWDDADITVSGKAISVKSTKHFGQLLLLEQKDWDENGFYIPNEKKYDYIVLVRIKPSCDEIIKIKYPQLGNVCDNEKRLKDIICSQIWTYDYAGYITYDELKYIIAEKYIIPQGAMLNGRRRMDASNYYVQAGDLNTIDRNGWIIETEEEI